MVLTPRRWCQACNDALRRAGDGGKKARSPGRARSKPSNHCAGKAGCVRLNLWFLPRAYFTHGGHGYQSIPGLPCALSFLRRVFAPARLGRRRREAACARPRLFDIQNDRHAFLRGCRRRKSWFCGATRSEHLRVRKAVKRSYSSRILFHIGGLPRYN